MTEPNPDLTATKRRLRTVAANIARIEALYEERLMLFRELAGMGLTHRQIGELAGVGWQAVSKALRKAP